MLHRELEVGRLVITTMNTRRLPARIVCLTTETVEVLYALGEDARIAGISGYTVIPPRARKEKPKVFAFSSGDLDRILAVEPDLVLGFSDMQADVARDLIKAGVAVHVFNQRSVDDILAMIETVGRLVGAEDKALALVAQTDFSPVFDAAPVRLAGLEPQARYRVTLPEPWPAKARHYLAGPEGWREGLTLSGAALMTQGLALPLTHPETAWLIALEKIA